MGHAPLSRAIGGTFEFPFKLPKIANRGNTQPRKPRKNASPKPANTKIRTAPKVQKNKRTYQDCRTHHLARAAKRRADSTAQGLCVACRQPAITGQTRCPACAEKHRQGNRRRSKGTESGPINADMT